MAKMSAAAADQTISDFHRLWFGGRQNTTWKNGITYMGIPIQQTPTDMWVLELIHETQPSRIIEVGVKRGGQTLYLRQLMKLAGLKGRVIGIDVSLGSVDKRVLTQQGIDLLRSDSIDPKLHKRRSSKYCREPSALVILDGNHKRDHVLQELRLFQRYVPLGGYIVVNDTIINGHPINPGWGPGPWEAVHDFLAETDAFEIDKGREKLILTSCSDGFLKRVK